MRKDGGDIIKILLKKYLPIIIGAPLLFCLTLLLTDSRYGWRPQFFIVLLLDLLFLRLADDISDYNVDVVKKKAVFPDYVLTVLACAVGVAALFFSGIEGIMIQAFYLCYVMFFGFNFYLGKYETDFSQGKAFVLPLALAVLISNVGTVGFSSAIVVSVFAVSLEFYILKKREERFDLFILR